MTEADHMIIALRAIAPGGKLKHDEIPMINALVAKWVARFEAARTLSAPSWITTGRALIGQKEIPGPKHNSWIAKGWARLGATWFNDDETPWCGFFIAHCLDANGLPYPMKGEFARALAWSKYGKSVSPQVGAIGVKQRSGGGHVFFIIGETPDGLFFKALEGNANNQVRIGDVRKSDVISVRWPAICPETKIPLPVMPAGTIATTEA